MLEPLESRLLCSAVRHAKPVFSVSHGTLSVSGSVGNDEITVRTYYNRTHLTLNGTLYAVRHAIQRVVVYGGGGDDYLRDAYTFVPSVHFDGGTGNDVLNSQNSAAVTTFLGGSGDDVLTGESYSLGSHPYMDGGPGDDRLSFGSTMYGGRGYDTAEYDPGAFAEYGPSVVVTGGLEKFRDSATGRDLPERANLSSRRGNLLMTFRPDGEYFQNVSGPRLEDRGLVVVDAYLDHTAPAAVAPGTVWRVPLDTRYTALALKGGLVLTFSGLDSLPPLTVTLPAP